MNLFNDIIPEVEKIEGWFSSGEMTALYPLLPESGLIVELGTYRGRSTMFFSLSAPKCQIITIDLCKQYDVKETIPEAADPIVLARPNVKQIAGDCLEIVKTFDDLIDFLFIDTRHTYEDTLANLEAWSKFVVRDGYIALHDYQPGFPGVKQAVDEFLTKHPEYDRIDLKLGIGLLHYAKRQN